MDKVNFEKTWSHFKSLKETVGENTILSKEINNLEEEIKQIGEKISEDYESLVSTNADLRSQLDNLQSKVDDLELQIKELRLENEEHRKKESEIALGQITWLYEQSLAMFILPEKVENEYGPLDAELFMNNWLEENKESDEGKERKKLYNCALSLQKVNKNLNIEHAKKIIRRIRNSPAHPDKVDLDDARLQIETYLPSLKKECLHIIETVEKLHSLMKLGRLARELQNGVHNFVFNKEGNKSIQDIQKILEDNKKTEPHERWMYLKGEIDWNNDHNEALEKIQNLKRNERPNMCLLQDVNLDTAKKYVVEFVPEYQCDYVINLIKKLNGFLLGQLAKNFQDGFSSYVMTPRNVNNVREMTDWLKREKNTQDGQQANRRRNKITKGITWTESHQTALEEMMKLKGEYHIDTEINVAIAKLCYIDFLPKNLRKPGFNILEMYERLQKVELHY